MPPASSAVSTPGSPEKSKWAQALLPLLAFVFALAMGLYGLLAIDTGYVNFRGAGNADVVAQRQEMRQSAETGQRSAAEQNIREHSGLALAGLAAATSPRYAYGERGLIEPLLHYAEMPARSGYALALHNTMGGLLMLFGGLQFWPALRRKYPRWHRAFGMVYVGAAVIGMLAAITYLLQTPVTKIYDGLTFASGLWFLAIGVLGSIGLSMYHLRRREIAQHQAYMAISYGFLLTAPLQRYGWLLMGVWQPDIRQLEGNYAVTAWLIPFSLLVGYGLFTINRLLQEKKPAALRERALQSFPRAQTVGQFMLRWMLLPSLALAVIIIAQYFLLAPGLIAYVGNSGLIPAGVLALDQAVIGVGLISRTVFALASISGLLLGGLILWQAFIRQQNISRPLGWGLVIAAAGAGTAMAYWGVVMGPPRFATLTGGATWLCGAFLCLAFSALMAWALSTRQESWLREWSLFLVLILLGAPAFYLIFPVLAHAHIPAQDIAAGHLFRMASYGQWSLLLYAFFYSVYGQATQERWAR